MQQLQAELQSVHEQLRERTLQLQSQSEGTLKLASAAKSNHEHIAQQAGLIRTLSLRCETSVRLCRLCAPRRCMLLSRCRLSLCSAPMRFSYPAGAGTNAWTLAAPCRMHRRASWRPLDRRPPLLPLVRSGWSGSCKSRKRPRHTCTTRFVPLSVPIHLLSAWQLCCVAVCAARERAGHARRAVTPMPACDGGGGGGA